FWSDEDVEILNLSGKKEEIAREVESASKTHDRVICLTTPLQFSYDGINAADVATCCFLHFNLGRIKSAADERIIDTYSKEVSNNHGFILSGLLPEYMETYIGELPKQRNMFRRIIKKLINRDLSWT
ncbi:MAG: hypothetical protein HRT61_22265, partial [Ekhidna sp.]|nr:hypothetical protein [Ekhidna sp.]